MKYSASLPKKSLGQHWLKDEVSLKAVISMASLDPSDVILEIGPGQGALTSQLLDKVDKVIAIELDRSLSHKLAKKFKATKLQIVNEDILNFNLSDLPKKYKIVANIPYYLTSNLIRYISESSNPPGRAVLLIQKEVAQRLASYPGDMSLLSVTAQFYWQVSLGDIVLAKYFDPPPKVDSQIVCLEKRIPALFTDIDSQKLFNLVRAGFSMRRKTLLNNLSHGLEKNREDIVTACQNAGIEESRRAQTLSLEEWHKLYLSLYT